MKPPATTPVVMDVDTGIDDAIALLLAVRSPVIDLVGVGTVLGNVDVATATRNTLRVLEIAGSTVPVAAGADRHLLEPDRDARFVHGDDGLGDTGQPDPTRVASDEHAVDQLIRLSHEHADALVVVAVGPLTNLALALRRDPTLTDRLAHIVVMGGSARAGGNRGPWAEANIASDPEAAATVFGADVLRTMIGLDVTSRLTLDDDDVARLAADPDPVAAFAARILPFYIDFYAGIHGTRRCAVHDALAVAAVIDPTLVTTERLPVTVETAGTHTRGMTVVDVRPRPATDVPRTDVALDVDVDRARDELLTRLLSGSS